MAEADFELSKSAKRRAAKKARDSAFQQEAPAAPETTPEKPKGKEGAKAKAAPKAEPKGQAQAKPKESAKAAAKPKAAPKEEPKKPEPKADPKAKAKAKSAPEAKAKEAPKAKAEAKPKAGGKKELKAEPPAPEPAPKPKAEPKPAAKQAPKASGKPKAAPKKEEEAPERVEVVQPYIMDDGTGGDWEQSTGLSKKAEKRKEKQEQVKKDQQARTKEQKLIPGMAPTNMVPGMAPPKAASKEEIAAFMAKVAAKGAEKRSEMESKMEADQAAANSLHTATIKVPENKIGVVIGPKGSKINMIKEKTGVARIDASGEMFTIVGQQQAVEMAHAAIKELIEKGYCQLAFEDFKEEGVMVHPSTFPDLIGKQGVTIKAFKTEMNVEVTIPEVPKNSTTSSKKYKVTLAGKAADVQKAKEVLEDIKKYGYHEITHPGQTHEEIEVEPWAYKFLIGKAGSELRHIQNNYKVKVNIPREHSICQNVVVVGGVGDVARAKDYIDNLMWKAHNQPQGGRSQDAAIDTWGGDEEEEEWMKAYIYKR